MSINEGDKISKMLSDTEMRKELGYKIPLWTVPQLEDINDINDLFINEDGDKFNCALVLYQSSNEGPTVIGHWTLLKRLDDNNIVHFDSYGHFPDDQLNSISNEYRRDTNQMKRNLSRLLVDSDYKTIHYNPHKYQNYYRVIGGNRYRINTCGRHCVVYAKSKFEPEEYFKRMKKLKNIMDNINRNNNTYDDIVSDLTE
jgi:hypothetical protein